MALSGQVLAHKAQPIHFALSVQVEKRYPLLLKAVDITIIFLGQAVVQSSQPLHLSLRKNGLGITSFPLKEFYLSIYLFILK